MKLLLVEDNRQLADQLADALTDQNYVVDVARDGEEGWDLMTYGHYDLVMLDITLPKLDGVSLCRKIRAQGYQTPVLMLTARSSSNDKVNGLDAGADDYMAKPVTLNELNARLRALLRRNHKELTPVLQQGLLKLDPSSCQVTYDEQPVKLSPKEYLLLELFLRNSQRIYSRKAILDQLWGLDAELPGEDTVKAHIKGLRQRLRAVGVDNLIESVYGLGYRLNTEYADPRTASVDKALTEQNLLIITSEGNRAEKLQTVLGEWRSTPMGFVAKTELITHLNAIQPDLLVLDLTHENGTNFDLCTAIRQDRTWAWLPIVALVGTDDSNVARQAYQAGCDDVLTQPIPVNDLQIQVQNRLERSHTLRKHFSAKSPSKSQLS